MSVLYKLAEVLRGGGNGVGGIEARSEQREGPFSEGEGSHLYDINQLSNSNLA